MLASAGPFGQTRAEALHGHAVPLCGVAGDQQAALFGHACIDPGMGKNTYGTGSFVLLNAGQLPPEPPPGVLATLACTVGQARAYALEASIFVTGAAVQWLRDGLGIIERAEQTEALARGLDSNEGVYFVPALTGLGSPHWDADARGTIVGLTRGSSRAHLARATLEAIAYQTVDAVRAMELAAPEPLVELRADGGASANGWLMQFQAGRARGPCRARRARRDDGARRRVPRRRRRRPVDRQRRARRAGSRGRARAAPLRAADRRGRARDAAGRLGGRAGACEEPPASRNAVIRENARMGVRVTLQAGERRAHR